MQTANIFVALNGDRGTTVPKYRVSAAEILVLRTLHGADAVFDVEPTEDSELSDRAEFARLGEIYGRRDPLDPQPSVPQRLFPNGVGMPKTLDDLDLDESFYKAERRMKPKAADPLDHDEDGKKGGSKPRKKAAAKDDAESDIFE